MLPAGREDEARRPGSSGGTAVANHDSVATPKGAVQAAPTRSAPSTRLDVHLRGGFRVTQPAWQIIREQGYRRIVSTSSGAGLLGNIGWTDYGAARVGLVG